jgi:hypothetical protein
LVDPAEAEQLGPSGLDPAEVDVEEGCDPGGLDSAPGVEAVLAAREAAEEYGQCGSDYGGAGLGDEESEESPRDEDRTSALADGIERLFEFGGLGKFDRVGTEGDGAGVGQSSERGPDPAWGESVEEPGEFGDGIIGCPGPTDVGATSEHLVCGEPGLEVVPGERSGAAGSPGCDEVRNGYGDEAAVDLGTERISVDHPLGLRESEANDGAQSSRMRREGLKAPVRRAKRSQKVADGS